MSGARTRSHQQRLRSLALRLSEADANLLHAVADRLDGLEAAAPGSDPAPKVGDRVPTADEMRTLADALGERSNDSALPNYEREACGGGRVHALRLADVLARVERWAVVPGAPVGVSETEGDR